MGTAGLTVLRVSGLVLFSLPAAAVTLADSRKTDYRVVVPRHADLSTKAVAKPFAPMLAAITGAQFPIVTDEMAPCGHELAKLGTVTYFWTNCVQAPLSGPPAGKARIVRVLQDARSSRPESPP